MRKWTPLIIVFGVASMVAAAADGEPQFQGRSLSDWAKQIDPHGGMVIAINETPVPESPLQTAIRSIGTNAIPTLLSWLKQKDPPDPEGKRTCFDTTSGQRAEIIFGMLGGAARPAIADLTKLALTFPDRERYDRCINILIGLAPESTASLKKILDKGSDEKRFTIVQSFALFDTNSAVLLLPEVIKCLVGKDENLGYRSAQSLSESSLPSQLLLPALTNAFPSASTAGRGRIFRCLYWSKYPAKEAVPLLRKALSDSNAHIRQESIWALQRIAPEILTNTPAK